MFVNVANWMPCNLILSDNYTAIGEEVLWNDVTLVVTWRKNNAPYATKTLTSANWAIGNEGGYSIEFSALECDTVGRLDYWVSYPGCTPYYGSIELEVDRGAEIVDIHTHAADAAAMASMANSTLGTTSTVGTVLGIITDIADAVALIPTSAAGLTTDQASDIATTADAIAAAYGSGAIIKMHTATLDGIARPGVIVTAFRDSAMQLQYGGVQVSRVDGGTFWAGNPGDKIWIFCQSDGYTFSPNPLEVVF